MLERVLRLGISGGAPDGGDPPADPSAGQGSGASEPEGGKAGNAPGGDAGKGKSQDPPKDPALVAAENEAKKLRHEKRQAEWYAAEAAEKLRQKELAELSEAEREKKARIEAETELKALRTSMVENEVRFAVLAEAAKLNVIDPEAAYRLIDREAVIIENGKPTNVAEVVKALVEKAPYLLKAGNGSGSGPANPATPQGRKLTPEDVKKMTAEEVARNWDDAKAAVAKS